MFTNNEYYFEKRLNFLNRIPKIGWFLERKLNRIYSIFKLKKNNFDLFHPTYFDIYFLKHLKRPFVLTIFDMIYEKMPEYFGKNSIPKNKALLAQKAEKIIAISHKTKQDIIDLYGIHSDKIEVVYLASSIQKFNLNPNLILPKRYILYVGSRFGYKNFIAFLEEVSDVILNDSDLCLVCVGGGSFNSKEIELITEIGVNQKVFQMDLSEDDLYSVYNQAEVFVFPSLYEGFGIPILEAFASECPVILTDASCFPEIAEDAALFFNPYIKGSLNEVVSKLLKSDQMKTELIIKGKERLSQFSWQKTSEKTMRIYNEILYQNTALFKGN